MSARFIEQLTAFLQEARLSLQEAQSTQVAEANRFHREHNLCAGDSVYLKTEHLPVEYANFADQSRKLQHCYAGPFQIARVRGNAVELKISGDHLVHWEGFNNEDDDEWLALEDLKNAKEVMLAYHRAAGLLEPVWKSEKSSGSSRGRRGGAPDVRGARQKGVGEGQKNWARGSGWYSRGGAGNLEEEGTSEKGTRWEGFCRKED
ncbi:hypothetical protein RUND412_008494 [Rhizina undulata]